jgi:hypothetical protein
MFVNTILQALNRYQRPRHRKLTAPTYPTPSDSDAANVRTGLIWFFVVVLLALSFALI